MTTVTADERPAHAGGPKPLLDGQQPQGRTVLVHIFVLAPTLALAAAVPLAWGWGLTWRGQVDMSARVIWLFEKLGWAHDVRWPTPTRLARLDAAPHAGAR